MASVSSSNINRIPLKSWLEINQLQDVANLLASATSLDELLSLKHDDRSAILSALCLNRNQINRVNQAVNNTKFQNNRSAKPMNKNVYNYNKNFFDQFKSLEIGQNDAQRKQACHRHPNNFDNAMEYLFQLQRNDDDNKDASNDPQTVVINSNSHNKSHNNEKLVLPLIYPNNATYNAQTGTMSINENIARNKLLIYQPALDFISNISSKVATVSIVGRARSGKSFVASELYAPGKVPCPFDLGSRHDACTFGVWISAETIKHPYEKDTVVVIFDVEGTGFHEAHKHNDMQLMVITLLISSYFIYNSVGTFTAPCLNELQFITELTQQIHSTPTDSSGQDFKKFFPKFMWLLRDVQLEPTIDNKRVTVREYFTTKVLKHELGMSNDIMRRQHIRQVFLQLFQTYDAFALPIPTSDKRLLRQLGVIPRHTLQREFNHKLNIFCDKVLQETKTKALFTKSSHGSDQFLLCRGFHLAEWIRECVECVNDPNKIPQISSMTSIVMSNVYKTITIEAKQMYQSLFDEEVHKLPLEESQIVEIHLCIMDRIFETVASGLQPSNANEDHSQPMTETDQQQMRAYKQLMSDIGHHNDVRCIGKQGILYQIFERNRKLSTDFCIQFLQHYFDQNISSMLQNPRRHTANSVLNAFTKMEKAFYSECKGPSKAKCWKEFNETKIKQSIDAFKQMKGFNAELIKTEQAAAIQREKYRQSENNAKEQMNEIRHQQKLIQDEKKRMEKRREVERNQFTQQMAQAEQRMIDMKESQWNELAEAFQQSTKEMNQQLVQMQQQNSKDMQDMMKQMNDTLQAIKNRPPPQITHEGNSSNWLNDLATIVQNVAPLVPLFMA